MTDEVLHPDWTVSSVTRDKLGESPVWVAEERSLYWVDFYGPIVRRLSEDGEVTSWTLPGVAQVGSIVAATGGLLAATDKGLFVFNARTGDFSFAGNPNEGRVGVGLMMRKLIGRAAIGSALSIQRNRRHGASFTALIARAAAMLPTAATSSAMALPSHPTVRRSISAIRWGGRWLPMI